uniref:dTDP-4-dehydrorhamnose reductase n=1 Tax=Thermofilum pendens TaxID=2269 RepID=A0A7C1PM24_THEPE
MKILVTGASSLPGYRVVLAALRQGHEVVALHFSHDVPVEHERLRKIKLDITDAVRLQDLVLKERPEAVVHAAALGDVDECERNRELAWRVNVASTAVLAQAAEVVNSFVLYLSTDYVFDGERGMYSEREPPYPVNYYGLTKLMGEVAVQARCSRWSIVRASSIYGLGPGRVNFAKFLVEKLSKGERVKALVDQYTSPSHAALLAEAVVEILERRMAGIFHVVGERMSRYEFALKVAEVLGFDKSLISPAKMEEFKWFAKRPRDSSLAFEETRSKISCDFYSTEKALETLKAEFVSSYQQP